MLGFHNRITILNIYNIVLALILIDQGRRNVFTTGPAKLDYEDYAIKCMGGRQLHEY